MPQSFILVQLGPSWPPPPPWPPPTTTTTKTTTAKTKANNIINVHNQWSFQQGNLQEQHMFSPLLSVWIISMFLFEYPLHQQFCLFPPSYSYPLSNHKSPHRIHHVLRHHACEHQISHVMPSPPPPTKILLFPRCMQKKLEASHHVPKDYVEITLDVLRLRRCIQLWPSSYLERTFFAWNFGTDASSTSISVRILRAISKILVW